MLGFALLATPNDDHATVSFFSIDRKCVETIWSAQDGSVFTFGGYSAQ